MQWICEKWTKKKEIRIAVRCIEPTGRRLFVKRSEGRCDFYYHLWGWVLCFFFLFLFLKERKGKKVLFPTLESFDCIDKLSGHHRRFLSARHLSHTDRRSDVKGWRPALAPCASRSSCTGLCDDSAYQHAQFQRDSCPSQWNRRCEWVIVQQTAG